MSAAAATYGESVAGILRREYGHLRFAEKLVARKARVSPRTVRNWLAGECGPRGAELIRLMASCDALRDEVLRLVEEAKCEGG